MPKALIGVSVLAVLALSASDEVGHAVVWTDQFTGQDEEALGVVASATDVYVSGSTEGTLPGQASAGGVDRFLGHLDASGNEIWQVQSGTSEVDSAYAVAMDAAEPVRGGCDARNVPGQTSVDRDQDGGSPRQRPEHPERAGRDGPVVYRALAR
jgi:hypothetical protein